MSRVIYEIKGERTGLHEVYHPRGKLPLVADIFLSKKASPPHSTGWNPYRNGVRGGWGIYYSTFLSGSNL